MRRAPRGYVQTLRCKAATGQIWEALVQPEILCSWHAEDAVVDPRQGGRYGYRSRLFGRREAHIDLFEPGRRLRLVFEPNPSWPAAGGAVIVEDFLLDVHPTGTRRTLGQLRLIGAGVPATPEWDSVLKRLQAGWAVAFSYLQQRLEESGSGRLAS